MSGAGGFYAPRATLVAVPEAAFAAYALIYFALEHFRRGRRPALWGRLHFWTSFVAVNLFLLPVHVLPFGGLPRRFTDYPDAFSTWNDIASVGYVGMLAAQVFFVAVLIDAFRRAPDLR